MKIKNFKSFNEEFIFSDERSEIKSWVESHKEEIHSYIDNLPSDKKEKLKDECSRVDIDRVEDKIEKATETSNESYGYLPLFLTVAGITGCITILMAIGFFWNKYREDHGKKYIEPAAFFMAGHASFFYFCFMVLGVIVSYILGL